VTADPPPSGRGPGSVAAARNPLPRWRGFNLLEMYTTGSLAPFREDDFRWIAGWGFDFVRLPLCYTLWIKGDDPFQIDADGPGFARLDEAVGFGERHGLHVSLNLHRAPGYCVNSERREPFDLWRDPAAQDAFCLHWQTLARRYRGIGSARLSFDLLNEPPPPRHRFLGGFTRERHARVMRAAVAAIRQIDPARLIILDGLSYGRLPCPGLADLPNVAQSCRAYEPFELSHYRAAWMPCSGRWRCPAWPLGRDHFGRRWTRARLEKIYVPWTDLIARGVGVHCGEAGCYRHTPHDVFLAWLGDALEVLTRHGIGWALWNFRGPFGVLDSEREDVAYENWRGHRLDRALLSLLQAH
jgi:endoglucanase